MTPTLEIRDQPRLPIGQQVRLMVDGITHRLMRSMLTLCVVILAVAFLMNMLTESTIAGACKRGVTALGQRQRELSRFTALVEGEPEAHRLRRQLAALPARGWEIAAVAPWLGLNEDQARELRRLSVEHEQYTQWFDALKPGQQRLLAGNRAADQVMAMLADPAAAERFRATAREVPLSIPQGLFEYAASHRRLFEESAQAAEHLRQSREKLRAEIGSQGFTDWLTQQAAEASRREAAARLLAQHGLAIPPQRLEALFDDALAKAGEMRVLERISEPGVAQEWATRNGAVFEQQIALETLASNPARVDWMLRDLDAHLAQRSAVGILEARRVSELEDRLAADYGPGVGLNSKTIWLAIVSLLVCTAGITNAMLISVIERFREIATMKCLGALDGFVATLFLMEAGVLGFVGGVAGVVIGGAIGAARMLASYGAWVGQFMPWGQLLIVAGVCVACGLGLAMFSALYPAFAAARMAPVAAMRVE